MVPSHHLLFVFLHHFKLNTLLRAILIPINNTLMEGAFFIGDDDLAAFDERELMLVGKQILVFDFLCVEVFQNKLLFIPIFSFLFKLFFQDYDQPVKFDFELILDKLHQTFQELSFSFA